MTGVTIIIHIPTNEPNIPHTAIAAKPIIKPEYNRKLGDIYSL